MNGLKTKITWYTFLMDTKRIAMLVSFCWMAGLSLVAWIALKINGTVVNYLSILLLINVAYMFWAPIGLMTAKPDKK